MIGTAGVSQKLSHFLNCVNSVLDGEQLYMTQFGVRLW